MTLRNTGALPDSRVLHVLAAEMNIELGTATIGAARSEIARLGAWAGARPPAPQVPAGSPAQPGPGEAVLSTWHLLLDGGRMQDGEPFLAGTAKRPRVHLSPATAAEIGAVDGAPVTVSTSRGSITLPLIVADLPGRVVWIPTASAGSAVHADLAADAGAIVRISTGSSR